MIIDMNTSKMLKIDISLQEIQKDQNQHTLFL